MKSEKGDCDKRFIPGNCGKEIPPTLTGRAVFLYYFLKKLFLVIMKNHITKRDSADYNT